MSDLEFTPHEPEEESSPAIDPGAIDPGAIDMGAISMGAPGPSLLGTGEGTASSAALGAIDPGAIDLGAPGPSLLGTGEGTASSAALGAIDPGVIDLGAPGPSLLGTGEGTASSAAPWPLSPSFAPADSAPPARIPHMGHLALLAAFVAFGFVCMMVAMGIGLLVHFDGVTKIDQIKTHIIYLLGSQAVLYLAAFVPSYFLFPLFWQKSFFAGIHWRARTALHRSWLLGVIAVGCFGLAMLDEVLLPGPEHAPIEDLFRTPGAAWTMFFFGITLAPFFEEVAFRGFLLPSFATAWDWIVEKSTGKAALPLDENGHPQWSLTAMMVAAVPTSLLFELIHADQQGHSLGPFLQVLAVSLILCAVRLKLRSVAASTLVHAAYNLLIFSTMLISSGGFRHLDKM